MAPESTHRLTRRGDRRGRPIVHLHASRRECRWSGAGQQLVQHDTKGIHIGRGRGGATLPLFRCAVFGRDEPHLGPCGRRLHVPCLRVEELGDAKIEQLHIPGSRHENVRRLEVAVHDEGAVRVLHGLAHRAKQTKTSFKRQTLGGAPFRDRNSVHELHDEVGCAVGRESAVDETGDAGMDQARQHLSLSAKALDGVRVARARTHKLDRHLLAILTIGSLGPVHRAHAAVSEGAQQTPWSKTVAEQWIDACRISLPIDDESFDREGAVVASGRQHGFELVA